MDTHHRPHRAVYSALHTYSPRLRAARFLSTLLTSPARQRHISSKPNAVRSEPHVPPLIHPFCTTPRPSTPAEVPRHRRHAHQTTRVFPNARCLPPLLASTPSHHFTPLHGSSRAYPQNCVPSPATDKVPAAASSLGSVIANVHSPVELAPPLPPRARVAAARLTLISALPYAPTSFPSVPPYPFQSGPAPSWPSSSSSSPPRRRRCPSLPRLHPRRPHRPPSDTFGSSSSWQLDPILEPSPPSALRNAWMRRGGRTLLSRPCRPRRLTLRHAPPDDSSIPAVLYSPVEPQRCAEWGQTPAATPARRIEPHASIPCTLLGSTAFPARPLPP
ncbi:hypothetical protein DFH09DRAFT_1312599 [Mycena vulgaris]|nr:hypothetical protein DFH09DRAFT_1312599 [Mycena vulgaris]